MNRGYVALWCAELIHDGARAAVPPLAFVLLGVVLATDSWVIETLLAVTLMFIFGVQFIALVVHWALERRLHRRMDVGLAEMTRKD